MMAILKALLLLGSAAASVIDRHPYAVHEKREVTPDSWTRRHQVDSDRRFDVQIFLKQSGLEQGAAHLAEISDPSSAKYGQHWSADDVAQFFKPDSSALDSVYAWLADHGFAKDVVKYSPNRASLKVPVTAADFEILFKAPLYLYNHVESDANAVGCDDYSLPLHIRDHIDFITPSTSLSAAPRKRDSESAPQLSPPMRIAEPPKDRSLSNCPNGVTPECIRALYQIPLFTGTPSPDNSLGIFNTQEGPADDHTSAAYSQQDLDSFFATYAPEIPAGTHPINGSINGGVVAVTNATLEGGEAMLDYSCAYPIVHPQNITGFVTSNGFRPSSPGDDAGAGTGLETLFDALDASFCPMTGADKDSSLECGTYKPTNVISVSYENPELAVGYRYATRLCDEFMKLSLQGTTIVASSGDYGVGPGGFSGGLCTGTSGKVFEPDWISTCPYVLSVGGTQLPPGADVTRPGAEIAWYASFGHASGGGFSNYFAMPDWQNATVAGYLGSANLSFTSYAQLVDSSNATLGAGSNGTFNRIGRAYPDVSALAAEIDIFFQGKSTISGGTSASAPIWAAILTRINEARLAAGKSTVGFVNPVLYKNPGALADVVNGTDNVGCGYVGFKVQKGWDPVTGLGSPVYPKLLEVFMGLP